MTSPITIPDRTVQLRDLHNNVFDTVAIAGTKIHEVLEDWEAELRKDGLKQTTGTLADSRGECCIGVLGRVVRDKHSDLLDELRVCVTDRDHITYARRDVVEMDAAGEAMGRNESLLSYRLDQALFGEYGQGLFYRANDSMGQTFPEIADAVQALREGDASKASQLLLRPRYSIDALDAV